MFAAAPPAPPVLVLLVVVGVVVLLVVIEGRVGPTRVLVSFGAAVVQSPVVQNQKNVRFNLEC